MEPIKEVAFERIYNATPIQVWEAWTNPEQLKQWWGPDNVLIPECEVDLRVGGKFYIVMEASEAMGSYAGTQWPMEAEFTEIVPHSKLTYSAKAWTKGKEEETQIDTITEILFTEENDKTKVNLKSAILKIGPAAGMAVQGMQHGFTQQLDKLNKFLAQ